MDANKILQDLRNKKYHPIYLLHGDESYYIDLISDFIEDNVLQDVQKGFDQTILYGKDTDFATLVAAAKRFPMMGEYQVIIVKEAQSMKWRGGDDLLVSYLTQPVPSTILVLAYKHDKFDKRRKAFKLAQKAGVVLESSRLYPNKIAAWVEDYLRQKERKIHPHAAALIGEYLGADLSKIVNELDKMLLNIPSGSEVSLKDIETNIGISKDYNVFELNSALGQRNALQAYKIVDYFASNPKNHPVPVVIGALGGYFTKILKYHYLSDKNPQSVARELGVHPFFTKEYEQAARLYDRKNLFRLLHVVHDYDLRSKGLGAADPSPDALLKELVFKILN